MVWKGMVQMQIGMYGSPMHVMTNDKVQDKKGCLKAIGKDALKDTAKIGGITLGTAAAASLVTGNSKKVSGLLSVMKLKFATFLDTFAIKRYVELPGREFAAAINDTTLGQTTYVSLKEVLKDSEFVKKLNSLPTPAKAGLLAGGLAFMIASPIILIANAAKGGATEAKFEER